MRDLSQVRKEIGQTINYSGMNQFDMEEAYSNASMGARDAWNEATELNRAIQAQRATDGSYLSDMEDMDENEVPSISELEAAFTDAIKTFFNMVKDKIESIIASITKWLDEKFTKLDEDWWDKHSEKAFSSEATKIKDIVSMIPWELKSSTKKLGDEAKRLNKEVEDAIDHIDDSANRNEEQKEGKGTGKFDYTGDVGTATKSDELLNSIFTGGKKTTKKEKIKLSIFNNESDLKEIFLRSREDRQAMKDMKKELTELRKSVDGINASDFTDDKTEGEGDNKKTTGGKAALSMIKKNINTLTKFTKSATTLIMARRSDIKMIVGKRYSFAVGKEAEQKRKEK